MRTWLAALGLVLGLAVAVGADDMAERLAPYLRAREAGVVGEVRGQVWSEPARPRDPPVPDPSVSVLLLPYSAEFEAQLDAAKTGLRESVKGMSEAVARVEAAQAAYESALNFAGGGELIRGEVSDDQGRIRIGGIPEGDWLLLAWKEHGRSIKKFRMPAPEARRYPNVPSNVEYWAVSYWRMRLTVRPGETTEATLTDRSVWMTAIKERLGFPDRAAPAAPQRR